MHAYNSAQLAVLYNVRITEMRFTVNVLVRESSVVFTIPWGLHEIPAHYFERISFCIEKKIISSEFITIISITSKYRPIP